MEQDIDADYAFLEHPRYIQKDCGLATSKVIPFSQKALPQGSVHDVRSVRSGIIIHQNKLGKHGSDKWFHNWVNNPISISDTGQCSISDNVQLRDS